VQVVFTEAQSRSLHHDFFFLSEYVTATFQKNTSKTIQVDINATYHLTDWLQVVDHLRRRGTEI
jgi:hypothetical protein